MSLEKLESILAKKKITRVSHVTPGYLVELECGHTMTCGDPPEQESLYCLECQIRGEQKVKGGR